jgi:ComF family protein
LTIVALLDLFMPPACAFCGRVGALLCPHCLDTFEAPSRSADVFLASDAGIVVGDSLVLAMAAFAYAGPMRRALAALKYSGASRLAPILAREAVPAVRRLLAISGSAVLVPVPVHLERKRVRGYNQAELIARELGRLARLPVLDVLDRVRPTTKQHQLNRSARLRNLRGALSVRHESPRVVILVDDIITTTATLEACASALCERGCDAAFGFALAREL